MPITSLMEVFDCLLLDDNSSFKGWEYLVEAAQVYLIDVKAEG